MKRQSEFKRTTKETDIEVRLVLDGSGICNIDTSIPFMDHMLTQMAMHGLFDMDIRAKGDIEVDFHHTVEDLGICIGRCIDKCLGDRKGIVRFSDATICMDEALARVVIDISNRPFMVLRGLKDGLRTGGFDLFLLKEFFKALTNNAGITLHIEVLYGEDPHHISEAIFKAFAVALDRAVAEEQRLKGKVPSSKGVI